MSKVISITSVNNRIITEAYKKEGLKSEVISGFAHLSQKVSSKGLKVLVDAKLNDGSVISKGSTVYIKEKLLHSMPWATEVLMSDAIGQDFIVVDLANVDFIVPPKED